ncbi:hypothetical protein HALLA_20905 (plasmid) [Halostagnicola larsenii XH-48]|uniref:Uncharacterized protein n=1 Tax=Halostagnicola larsenii XH-48 TaxID=797299 RepID=W0JUW3_9EURY|nr:hypothetical protein [Halostagnicola larsenii]AHG02366.1 hypothetical protein HALLA_20905 [Halostagnicola larsenii XH-48]
MTEQATASTTSSGGEINLTPEVPQWAYDIWQDAPDDPRDEWTAEVVTGYSGRSGDLTNAINNASGRAIVDLGSGGEYEMQTSPSSASLVGLIGDPDDPPTVYLTMTGTCWEMSPDELVLEGITFDISETSDVSLLRSYGISDRLHVRDITLRGERERVATGGGNRHNFLAQMGPEGKGLIERLSLPDGCIEDLNSSGDYAIPAGADPSHEGKNVWKDCYVEGFHDNGYYVRNSPGHNLLWNCEALNNARTNMRIGENDSIVGGHSEINTDFPHEEVGEPGRALGNDGLGFDKVVGLTCVLEGDDWGSAGFMHWSGKDGIPAEGGRLYNTVFHFKSGNSTPIRVDSRANPVSTYEDCYILDESGGNETFSVGHSESQPGTVTLNGGNQVDSNADVAFRMGTDGTLNTADGSSYSNTTISASQAGVDASLTPADFPTFYFDYEDDNGGGSGDGPIDLGTDTSADSTSNESGIHFEAKQEMESVRLTISQNSDGFTTCRLRDATSTDVVAERDVSHLQVGDTFEIGPDDGLDADTYLVTLDADGSEWTRGRFDNPSYPYSNDALSVIEGVYTSGGTPTDNVRYSFTEIAVGDGTWIGNGIDLGTDNDTDTATNESGIHFEAEQELDGIQLAISQNSGGFTTCRLRDATSTDVVVEKDVSDLQAGDTFEIGPAGGLEADTYLVTLDADGDEWTRGRFTDPSYPYSNDDLTVTEGVYTSGGTPTDNVRYSFTAIAATDGPETGDGLDLGTDNNADTATNESGFHFEAEQELDGIQLTISRNSGGFTTCRLRDATSTDVVVEKDVSDLRAGDTFDILPDEGLDADTYLVTLDANGSEWTRGRFADPSYPYSNDDLSVTEGIYTSGGTPTDNVRYSFTAIAGIDTV